MLEHQRGRAAAAVEQLGRAAGLRPENAEYRGKLGMALAGAGRLDEALAELDRAIELCQAAAAHSSFSIHHSAFPLAEAHYNRGVALDRLGRGEEAIAAWQRAIACESGHGEALNQLGRMMLERERWKEAH